MDKKKVAGGAERSVEVGNISDVNGQVAIGEDIYQMNLIFNVYGSSLEEGKFEEIPQKIREQIEIYKSRIKKAESSGTKISSDAYYTLGLSAYYERNFDTAEGYITKAVEKNPNNLDARNLLCTIYATRSLDNLNERRYEDIIKDSKKAESYFPYRPIAMSLQVMGYIYKNMYLANGEREYLDKAKEKFEIALMLDRNNVENVAGALNGLGNYYSFIGNYDMAINKHLEAIEISPQYASAHHDLALVYEAKMGENGSNMDEWRLKAIEEWKKATFFGKNDPAFSPNDITNIENRIRNLQ